MKDIQFLLLKFEGKHKIITHARASKNRIINQKLNKAIKKSESSKYMSTLKPNCRHQPKCALTTTLSTKDKRR